MKKTYIIPATESIILESAPILAGADSATFDSTKKIQSNEDIGVKGGTQSYDVWADDWSK